MMGAIAPKIAIFAQPSFVFSVQTKCRYSEFHGRFLRCPFDQEKIILKPSLQLSLILTIMPDRLERIVFV